MRQIFPFEEEPTLWDDMVLITGLVLDGLVAYADEAIAEVHEQHFGNDTTLDLHVAFQGYTGPMWGRLPDGRYTVQGQPGVMSEEQFTALQQAILQQELLEGEYDAEDRNLYGIRAQPVEDFNPVDALYPMDPEKIRQEIEGNWTPLPQCCALQPITNICCWLQEGHRGEHRFYEDRS